MQIVSKGVVVKESTQVRIKTILLVEHLWQLTLVLLDLDMPWLQTE